MLCAGSSRAAVRAMVERVRIFRDSSKPSLMGISSWLEYYQQSYEMAFVSSVRYAVSPCETGGGLSSCRVRRAPPSNTIVLDNSRAVRTAHPTRASLSDRTKIATTASSAHTRHLFAGVQL